MAFRFLGGFVVFLMLLVGLGAFIATAATFTGPTELNRWAIIVVAPLLVLAVAPSWGRLPAWGAWRRYQELREWLPQSAPTIPGAAR